MGMIARSTTAEVNVIALVGERGREVREFIERDLGEGLARSVVVVATSDQPALVRIRAAFTATAIAEYFRDQGPDVMLMMDSVTRFAMAQREVGLAIGEPPATRGYTPSRVRAAAAAARARRHEPRRLDHRPLHRAGRRRRHERADRRRRALDPRRPHRAARALADAGHYPAIDVLQSVSRLVGEIVTPEVRSAASRCAGAGGPREKADLISIGAYQPGTDPVVDAAIAISRRSTGFFASGSIEPSSLEEADAQLLALGAGLGQLAEVGSGRRRETPRSAGRAARRDRASRVADGRPDRDSRALSRPLTDL